MRRLLRPGGSVLIADQRVGDCFGCGEGDIEWMMYGFSVLHCLPVGMAGAPAAGTGTVMRSGTLRAYAEQAGYRDTVVLPIRHQLFRFYHLLP